MCQFWLTGPFISAHPQNDSVIEGQSAEFTGAGQEPNTALSMEKGSTNIGTDSHAFLVTVSDNGAQITVYY